MCIWLPLGLGLVMEDEPSEFHVAVPAYYWGGGGGGGGGGKLYMPNTHWGANIQHPKFGPDLTLGSNCGGGAKLLTSVL